MPSKNDWRCQGQERYLKGLTFSLKTYVKDQTDHDHCEFCNAKFMENGNESILTEGYTSKDRYRWICKDCFEDFHKEFNLSIEHVNV